MSQNSASKPAFVGDEKAYSPVSDTSDGSNSAKTRGSDVVGANNVSSGVTSREVRPDAAPTAGLISSTADVFTSTPRGASTSGGIVRTVSTSELTAEFQAAKAREAIAGQKQPRKSSPRKYIYSSRKRQDGPPPARFFDPYASEAGQAITTMAQPATQQQVPAQTTQQALHNEGMMTAQNPPNQREQLPGSSHQSKPTSHDEAVEQELKRLGDVASRVHHSHPPYVPQQQPAVTTMASSTTSMGGQQAWLTSRSPQVSPAVQQQLQQQQASSSGSKTSTLLSPSSAGSQQLIRHQHGSTFHYFHPPSNATALEQQPVPLHHYSPAVNYPNPWIYPYAVGQLPGSGPPADAASRQVWNDPGASSSNALPHQAPSSAPPAPSGSYFAPNPHVAGPSSSLYPAFAGGFHVHPGYVFPAPSGVISGPQWNHIPTPSDGARPPPSTKPASAPPHPSMGPYFLGHQQQFMAMGGGPDFPRPFWELGPPPRFPTSSIVDPNGAPTGQQTASSSPGTRPGSSGSSQASNGGGLKRKAEADDDEGALVIDEGEPENPRNVVPSGQPPARSHIGPEQPLENREGRVHSPILVTNAAYILSEDHATAEILKGKYRRQQMEQEVRQKLQGLQKQQEMKRSNYRVQQVMTSSEESNDSRGSGRSGESEELQQEAPADGGSPMDAREQHHSLLQQQLVSGTTGHQSSQYGGHQQQQPLLPAAGPSTASTSGQGTGATRSTDRERLEEILLGDSRNSSGVARHSPGSDDSNASAGSSLSSLPLDRLCQALALTRQRPGTQHQGSSNTSASASPASASSAEEAQSSTQAVRREDEHVNPVVQNLQVQEAVPMDLSSPPDVDAGHQLPGPSGQISAAIMPQNQQSVQNPNCMDEARPKRVRSPRTLAAAEALLELERCPRIFLPRPAVNPDSVQTIAGRSYQRTSPRFLNPASIQAPRRISDAGSTSAHQLQTVTSSYQAPPSAPGPSSSQQRPQSIRSALDGPSGLFPRSMMQYQLEQQNPGPSRATLNHQMARTPATAHNPPVQQRTNKGNTSRLGALLTASQALIQQQANAASRALLGQAGPSSGYTDGPSTYAAAAGPSSYRNHDVQLFGCPLCPARFNTFDEWMAHQKEYHNSRGNLEEMKGNPQQPPGRPSFECPQCSTTFSSELMRATHFSSVHPHLIPAHQHASNSAHRAGLTVGASPSSAMPQEKRIHVPRCKVSSTEMGTVVSFHYDSWTGPTMKCFFCHDIFEDHEALEKHIHNHPNHAGDLKLYQCGRCGELANAQALSLSCDRHGPNNRVLAAAKNKSVQGGAKK